MAVNAKLRLLRNYLKAKRMSCVKVSATGDWNIAPISVDYEYVLDGINAG